ncbi:MAG: hypothetical protein JSW39_23660, partial [Desulfobacterales bacterium]
MDIPAATYRIQFNPAFGFQDAAQIVAYLADLGISHLYASPIFQARPGSPHGYDIVDSNRLNAELGSVSDFEALAQRLAQCRMGWLQDIVPNHMAFANGNRMLMDVLENGQDSTYAQFFDIAWDHPYPNMHGRLLAPFLGRPYAECLANGEIQLQYGADGFTVNYYDLALPLKVET